MTEPHISEARCGATGFMANQKAAFLDCVSAGGFYAVADELDGTEGAEGGAFLPTEDVADVVSDEVDGAVGRDERFVAGA